MNVAFGINWDCADTHRLARRRVTVGHATQHAATRHAAARPYKDRASTGSPVNRACVG
jgi:hypothetical protein